MNTCPYCRADNDIGAVRCRHCTSWIAMRPMAREWYRAREGKMIAGVCAGLADRFGLPIALLRVLFILSVFAWGWGIIVYGALWVAMPLAPLPLPPAIPVAQAVQVTQPAAPPAPGPLVTPPPAAPHG